MANLLDWFKSILEAKPTECDKPEDLAGFSLSLFMVIGMFVSYLPQHFAIIKRKSSDGLSPWYQLLGALSMINILENALIFGYGLFECCSRVSAGKCVRNFLPILQVIVQFCCFMLMVWLFIFYFPQERRYVNLLGSTRKTAEYSRAVNIGRVILIYFIVTAVISTCFVFLVGPADIMIETTIWAGVLGLVSSVISSCQFIPQIFKTLRAGRVGSLSIPSMLMQVPGSFILVYTLSSSPGSNVTTWITYLFTGTLQTILLVICIVFTVQKNRRRKRRRDAGISIDTDYSSDIDIRAAKEPLLSTSPLSLGQSSFSTTANDEEDLEEIVKDEQVDIY